MTTLSSSHLWGVGYPDYCSHALGKHYRGGSILLPRGAQSGAQISIIHITPAPWLAVDAKICSKANFIYIILMLS